MRGLFRASFSRVDYDSVVARRESGGHFTRISYSAGV